MPVVDSDYSTLTDIRTKVRRLTRSPSTTQLTNDQIDDYVNTFVLYDFPEIILDKTLTFYTIPNVDVLSDCDVDDDDNPLHNFANKYINIHDPVYVNGNKAELSLSREQFFNRYPKKLQDISIGTGDGAETRFNGTLANIPALAGSITISSINDGFPIIVNDLPQDIVPGVQDITGLFFTYNDPDNVLGSINYITGVYAIEFAVAPGDGEDIRFSYYAYTPDIPRSILFENNTFTFRPVPDKTYRVDIGVYQRPTALLDDDTMPELAQWWQYIAYGAAKKVFEDRMDTESVDAIMPEFTRQRALLLKRLNLNLSEQRTATIYQGLLGSNRGL